MFAPSRGLLPEWALFAPLDLGGAFEGGPAYQLRAANSATAARFPGAPARRGRMPHDLACAVCRFAGVELMPPAGAAPGAALVVAPHAALGTDDPLQSPRYDPATGQWARRNAAAAAAHAADHVGVQRRPCAGTGRGPTPAR